jgi:hypothetical protein
MASQVTLPDTVWIQSLGLLDVISLNETRLVSRNLNRIGASLHEVALERELQQREVETVRRRLNTAAYVDALEDDIDMDSDMEDEASPIPSRRDAQRQAAFEAGFRAAALPSHVLSRWRGALLTFVFLLNQDSSTGIASDSASRVSACVARIDACLLEILRPHASGLAQRSCREDSMSQLISNSASGSTWLPLNTLPDLDSLRDNVRDVLTMLGAPSSKIDRLLQS